MRAAAALQLLWQRALPIAGVAVLVGQFALWLPHNLGDPEPYDLDLYHAAARHSAAGEQVYGRQMRVETGTVPLDFFYPPTALALLRPTAALSPAAFRGLGFAGAIVSMWLLAAALVKLATGAFDARKTLATGALLTLFAPVAQNLNTGNADMPVIAMTAWAFAVPAAAPFLLVFGASIKVYPAFALLAWWPRADWRYRRSAIMTAAVLLAVTLLVLDHRYIVEWIVRGLPSLSAPSTHYGNWSLSTVLLFPGMRPEISQIAWPVRALLSVAPFVAAAAAAIYLRKRPLPVAAVAALVAGTWFTALCWWWRILVLLTLPAALWIGARRETKLTGPSSSA